MSNTNYKAFSHQDPQGNVYNSTWSIEDVDMILGDYNLSPLSTNQKKECLEQLVRLLNEEIGMEYLREIVEQKIDSAENE